MKKKLLLIVVCGLMPFVYAMAQTYHEQDKEGLRVFLRQPSQKAGKLNLDFAGLSIADTLNWHTSEGWVEKIDTADPYTLMLEFNRESPKRITRIEMILPKSSQGVYEKVFDGVFDSHYFKSLEYFRSNDALKEVNINGHDLMKEIAIRGYGPQTLNVSNCRQIEEIGISSTEYTKSINVKLNESRGNPNMFVFHCTDNKEVTHINLENVLTEYTQCKSNPKLVKAILGSTGELICSKNPELLEMEGVASKELTCNFNPKLSKMNIQGSYLSSSTLDIRDNALTELNLMGLGNIKTVYCQNNKLTSLNLYGSMWVRDIYCEGSSLKFSTISPKSWAEAEDQIYIHGAQATLMGEDTNFDNIIDLSSEYRTWRAGKREPTEIISTYRWYDESSNEIELTNLGEGRFKAGKQYAGQTLTCIMNNAMFNLWDQVYQVKITGEEKPEIPTYNYHEQDKEGLRAFLRQPSQKAGMLNLEATGLSIADTLSWHTSEKWVEKIVSNFPYTLILKFNNESPKRIEYLEMRLLSPEQGGLVKVFDGVFDSHYFESLRTFYTEDALKEVNINGNDSLKEIMVHCYGPQTLNINNCRGIERVEVYSIDYTKSININTDTTDKDCYIQSFNCHSNKELTEINMKNIMIKNMECHSNPKLLKVVLDDVEDLKCYNNPELVEMDVYSSKNLICNFNPKLSTLNLTGNYYDGILDVRDNALTELRAYQLVTTEKIYCQNNQLTSLDFRGSSWLENIYCEGNDLKFSTVRLKDWLLPNPFVYVYAGSQANIIGEDTDCDDIIDLNSEYRVFFTSKGGSIEERFSTYKWYDENNNEIQLTDLGEGRFKAGKQYARQTLTCIMSNAFFDKWNQVYKVKITGEKEPENPDIENVYYNPSSGQVIVDSKVAIGKVQAIEIMTGKVARSGYGNKLSIVGLKPGVYAINVAIKSNGKIYSFKIMKD